MSTDKNTDAKQPVNGWISVTEQLPKPLQTVWLTNGKGWVSLGCLVEDAEGWHWAESNGVIYSENGEIVSECVSEDLDVKFWHELPRLPYCQPIAKKILNLKLEGSETNQIDRNT